MGIVPYLVPTLYVAALIWTAGGDFLRAQLQKDLERAMPFSHNLMYGVSLPTLCLVGALVVRLLVHREGLLLTALVLAMAMSMFKIFRVSLLRPAGSTGEIALSRSVRRTFSR